MIPLFRVHHPRGVGDKIEKLFESGFITEGEFSDRFEMEFSKYVENPNCSLVNSCTSALTLAYRLCNLNPGDEVITTPMTCMATNEPISIAGGKIVFADIDPATGNINPADVMKKITTKTKAIVGVHWAGQPFDIKEINKIASDNGIKVIEDAAHALGAKYTGKMIGSHSDFVCFSFQAIKHITTADGGAITSKEAEIDDRIKKLRWFGLDRKIQGSRWAQDISECGYKFHMNNLNAIIGLEQMKYVDNLISSHMSNGKFFDEHITNKKITKLKRDLNSESSYWIYTLLVDDRQSFSDHMSKNGIASDIVHVRNDKYSIFSQFQCDKLPGLDEFSKKMINIPVGWWLSEKNRHRIVDAVNQY